MFGERRARLLLSSLIAGLTLFAASCDSGVPSSPGAPAAGAGTDGSAPAVRLQAASMEYYTGGPGDPVVELRVILNNTSARHTDSTSIRWEPAFVQEFTFLRSEPEAWRMRVDETGWGVVDTSGVLPEQYGTFRIWFAMNTYAPREPRIAVVVNGTVEIAQATARATHLKWQADIPKQRVFERGLPAQAADLVRFLPTDGRGAFPVAMGMGVALIAVTGIGGFMAFRSASAPASGGP
jgi:hypothetical protein